MSQGRTWRKSGKLWGSGIRYPLRQGFLELSETFQKMTKLVNGWHWQAQQLWEPLCQLDSTQNASCRFAFTVSGFTSPRCFQKYFPEEFLWKFCACEVAVVENPSAREWFAAPVPSAGTPPFPSLNRWSASCVQPTQTRPRICSNLPVWLLGKFPTFSIGPYHSAQKLHPETLYSVLCQEKPPIPNANWFHSRETYSGRSCSTTQMFGKTGPCWDLRNRWCQLHGPAMSI